MGSTDRLPPLRPLHPDESLIKFKLEKYGPLRTPVLIDSLLPGREGSFKVRPAGMIVDGHRRIKILRARGMDVDVLPHEIIPKDPVSEFP